MEASSRRATSAEAEDPWGAGACPGSAERLVRCQVVRLPGEEAACSALRRDWGRHPG